MAIPLPRPMWTASLHHHGMISRTVRVFGGLRGAKAAASAAFGDDLLEATIILRDATGEIVSQRPLRDRYWQDNPAWVERQYDDLRARWAAERAVL